MPSAPRQPEKGDEAPAGGASGSGGAASPDPNLSRADVTSRSNQGRWWTHWPEWLRGRFSDNQRYLILWVLAGIFCGLTAVFFHVAIDATFRGMLWVTKQFPQPWGWVVLGCAPVVGGLLTGLLLTYWAPSAAGSGIPQTKVCYYRDFGVFKLRQAFARFVLGTLSIGSGMSLGREGPTVHICAALSSWFGQRFGISKKRVQAMVPVGMGAGIAAAFNTPLAAMFFVYEELLGDFSTKALFGMLVAVVLASGVERLILGEHPVFDVVIGHLTTDWWMLLSIPLGLLAAVFGHLFVTLLLRARLFFRERVGLPVWLKPAIGGLFVGILGISVLLITGRNGVFGIGYHDLADALNGHLNVLLFVGLLFVGKFGATLLAYASGASGGLFAPSLFIGGMLGAFLGLLAQPVFGYDANVVGAMALLGMGAFFAAVIRTPMTSFIIIIEMTRLYDLILPLMLGNAIAFILAARWRPVPIYDALLLQDKITLRKFPTYQGEQDWRNLPVSTIMTYDAVTVRAAMNGDEARASVDGRRHHAYPILGDDDRVVGIIMDYELADWPAQTPLAIKVRDQKLVTVTPDRPIRDVAHTLVVGDVTQAPVVSPTDATRLLGIVTLHDVARAQNAIDESLGR